VAGKDIHIHTHITAVFYIAIYGYLDTDNAINR